MKITPKLSTPMKRVPAVNRCLPRWINNRRLTVIIVATTLTLLPLSVSVWYMTTKKGDYSCGLSTATIEYSSLSVCVSVCLSVCLSVCVHDNSKNKGSIDLKLEHIVVYENSSDEFDIGHCPIKVKVMA